MTRTFGAEVVNLLDSIDIQKVTWPSDPLCRLCSEFSLPLWLGGLWRLEYEWEELELLAEATNRPGSSNSSNSSSTIATTSCAGSIMYSGDNDRAFLRCNPNFV